MRLPGHPGDLPSDWPPPTATPYGTSVRGRFAATSPHGPSGYGDGRCVSLGVAEGRVPGPRWEVQLKGQSRVEGRESWVEITGHDGHVQVFGQIHGKTTTYT